MITVQKDSFKSIILDTDLRIDEDDKIEFIVESTGEVKSGILMKIQGSKKERKFLIMPDGSECAEL